MTGAAIRALQRALRSDCVDAYLIASPINRRYFTGFPSTDGVLLITENAAELLVDPRYFEAARRQVKACGVRQFTHYYEALRERLRAHRVHRFMVEQAHMTLAEWEMLCRQLSDWVCVSSPVLENRIYALRQIKSPAELDALRRAQRLTEQAFDHILGVLRPGLSEREAALELEFFMRRHGAEATAFDLIVLSGARTALPHGVPTEQTIRRGDLIMMDTGAVVDGMHADMTRMVAIGSVSAEQRKIYQLVCDAQEAAIAAARAGISCKSVDNAARNVIERAGYGAYFGHAAGHGVGLEIHEPPTLGPGSSAVLEKDMVLTVEPGIYLNGRFGIRIEDMVCITQNGCENLTHARKDLILL